MTSFFLCQETAIKTFACLLNTSAMYTYPSCKSVLFVMFILLRVGRIWLRCSGFLTVFATANGRKRKIQMRNVLFKCTVRKGKLRVSASQSTGVRLFSFCKHISWKTTELIQNLQFNESVHGLITTRHIMPRTTILTWKASSHHAYTYTILWTATDHYSNTNSPNAYNLWRSISNVWNNSSMLQQELNGKNPSSFKHLSIFRVFPFQFSTFSLVHQSNFFPTTTNTEWKIRANEICSVFLHWGFFEEIYGFKYLHTYILAIFGFYHFCRWEKKLYIHSEIIEFVFSWKLLEHSSLGICRKSYSWTDIRHACHMEYSPVREQLCIELSNYLKMNHSCVCGFFSIYPETRIWQ